MTIPEGSKIDWFRVIADVCSKGHTLVTISTAIRVPRSTLIGWKQGATPGFEDGERLLDLWRQVMIPPAPSVPIVSIHSYRA